VATPTGTVTFLFTDIEGSTRRWEDDARAMRTALVAHDEVLRSAVENEGGFLFKHTGDGICAAFSSANAAVAAAVAGQRALDLPVRMGLATGNAELRGDDYHGPVLNRVARVMAAGHGGQVLLAGSTAGLVEGVDLADLGAHRLRDLTGSEHLFQVRAAGLRSAFPALRTLDAVPGNLPVQSTSFIGRDSQVKQVTELVRAHRLVTLTGVGGVGKSRLALQAGAGLAGEFPDGVWLVELAPVGDPAAVADAVATTLGIVPWGDGTVAQNVAEVLAVRRSLVVLDNCEHVLEAAAELVEAILARTATTTILATSREGLRVGAEQLWLVPSLALDGGEASESFELFVDRARAVAPGFRVDDSADAEAVSEICRRLDGIPLAIELAAARMVSMSALDVRDRLDDRFRLLAGGRRGVERHQTLRQAVAWSYDLLSETERVVLGRCAVFSGGFDIASAAFLCQPSDEYLVLDTLDSLVRKSLVTLAHVDRHGRYGLFETVRQFAEEQSAATGNIAAVRDDHARYFAHEAMAHWERWNGPSQRMTMDWVDREFANLRTAFRWACDHHDLETATAIAAHTAVLAFCLLQYESVGWASEILEAATTAKVRQLPRLYTAAGLCMVTGRPDAAVRYAEKAVALQADPNFDGFPSGFSRFLEAGAHLLAAGQADRCLDIATELANDETQPEVWRLHGRIWLVFALPAVGRAAEARMIADDLLAAARAHENPNVIAHALLGIGRAFADTDPHRALSALREGIEYSREHRFVYVEAEIAYCAAGLEAVYGDLDQALELFDFAIDKYLSSADYPNAGLALASLASLFARADQPEIASTLYGAISGMPSVVATAELPATVEHLRGGMGATRFDECMAAGAALPISEAAAYAREQIRLARQAVMATEEA
jgi:predicted ATPase